MQINLEALTQRLSRLQLLGKCVGEFVVVVKDGKLQPKEKLPDHITRPLRAKRSARALRNKSVLLYNLSPIYRFRIRKSMAGSPWPINIDATESDCSVYRVLIRIFRLHRISKPVNQNLIDFELMCGEEPNINGRYNYNLE
uniref:Uncharacterized protein n=1 Tax=Timema poppense TaxID=170557 RepID=A0A7R9GZI4_TIMPO|nr:unnamed protein product [Timema poppensis]